LKFDVYEGSRYSRRQFLMLLAQLFAIAAIPGCRKAIPILDATKPITPFVVEDHSQFLSRWAAQGIRDAVLINIDTHDDIVRISDNKISDLKAIYNRSDWTGFSAADEHTASHNGLFGVVNWIYAGGMLGIFSQVFWVCPYNLLDNATSDGPMRQLLVDLHFRDEDIATFVLHNNQFSGRINGVPFTICNLDSLPSINKPLLLSIDADFFPTCSAIYQVSYLNLLHKTFTALYAKKYKLLDAAVCYSINGEYLNPHQRWIGDAVVKVFADPGMIITDAPSELLKLQQHLENALRSGEADEILLQSQQYLKQHPDPSLLLYLAFGYMLKGDSDNAYSAAFESSRIDKRYSSGLQYMGTLYYLRKQYQTAEQFYAGGFSADPDMTVGLLQYGNCLLKLGKLSEALQVYAKDIQVNGSFPCHFMMVYVYMRLGDQRNAEHTLQEALKRLEMYVAPRVLNRDVADALYAILDYCDKKGLHTLADPLRRHPMTRIMNKSFPVGS
jgi:tetratricopeptide (TPR) repeat protein